MKRIACSLLLALLVGCSLSPGTLPLTVTPLQEVPAELSLNSPAVELVWDAEAAGEAVLELRAFAPGTEWSREGAEAATVTVYLDDSYRADVVLYAGARPHDYLVLLGPVEAGPHRLRILFAPDKSAPKATGVRVEGVQFRLYTPADPLYQFIRHSPIIYSRPGARFTDIPLVMVYELRKKPDWKIIEYTVIFSNEDGGTPPEGLMARWGRLTDIEWVYRVTVDENWEPIAAFYQAGGHKLRMFRGQRQGMHPILRVATKNNMVTDEGESIYRFALVPLTPMPPDHSREEVMDLFPWTYRVMAQEWAREGQERPTNPETAAVGDPRDYVYIEFHVAEAEGTNLPMCPRAAWDVFLQDRETPYSSDHHRDDLRVRLKEWHRVTVELPPQTSPGEITALRFRASRESRRGTHCAVTLMPGGKAFMLDEDYIPQEPFLTWDEAFVLDTDPSTPASAEMVLQVR